MCIIIVMSGQLSIFFLLDYNGIQMHNYKLTFSLESNFTPKLYIVHTNRSIKYTAQYFWYEICFECFQFCHPCNLFYVNFIIYNHKLIDVSLLF